MIKKRNLSAPWAWKGPPPPAKGRLPKQKQQEGSPGDFHALSATPLAGTQEEVQTSSTCPVFWLCV